MRAGGLPPRANLIALRLRKTHSCIEASNLPFRIFSMILPQLPQAFKFFSYLCIQ